MPLDWSAGVVSVALICQASGSFDAADDRAGVRVAHVEAAVASDLLARDPQRFIEHG